MRFFKLHLCTFALALTQASGCALSPAPPLIDADSNFDLSEYLFHTNALTEGSSVSFVAKYYRKDNVKEVAVAPTYQYSHNDGQIEVTSLEHDGVISSFDVGESTIVETHPGLNEQWTLSRFARLGDQYLDGRLESIALNQRCTLLEYFPSLHLSSATGAVTIAQDTYDNVIKVRCESEFVSETDRQPNFRWNIYYAKGLGPVFKDGDWTNHLGLVYTIYNIQR